MQNNYVIGGGGLTGLTELIVGYLTGFTVIKPKAGQAGKSFPLGPHILHEDAGSMQLLQRLGIYDYTNRYKVGYLYEGKLHSEMSLEMQQKYFEKTRGNGTPFASSMSGGKSRIIGWDMDKIRLVERLTEKCHIIETDVCSIDLKNKALHLSNYTKAFEYDKLISTMHIEQFSKLSGLPLTSELQSHPTTFLLIRCPDVTFDGYDYIYLIDSDVPFHRITRLGNGNAVLEIKGALSSKKIMKVAESFTVLDYKYVNSCQIVNSQEIKSFGGIPMIGRFAQWNHSIKANDVIREVRELCSRNYVV